MAKGKNKNRDLMTNLTWKPHHIKGELNRSKYIAYHHISQGISD
jgi:hypothetical protein